MIVIIDIDEAGHKHMIDPDPANWHKVEHPDGSGLTTVDQMLLHHNANPADREKGGWHIVNQLPGEDAPRTRWERLVEACNSSMAPAHIRALNLKA